jgi:hypothetical protein
MNSNRNPTTPQLGLFLNPPTYSHPYPFIFLYFFLAIIINTSFFLPFFSHCSHHHGASSLRRKSMWKRNLMETCEGEKCLATPSKMKQVNFFKFFAYLFSTFPPPLSFLSLFSFFNFFTVTLFIVSFFWILVCFYCYQIVQ